MVIDFRSKPPAVQLTTIKGQLEEGVQTYKYLGTVIDKKLTFNANTEMLCKTGQQRLFCLHKLSRFNVDKTLRTIFYKASIESVLTFSFIWWFCNLSLRSRNALSKTVKVRSTILGVPLSSLTDSLQ